MITESIPYLGSKNKLLTHILDIVPKDVKSVCDAFAGSTRVSQAFAQQNYDVTCNDLAIYSKYLGECYLYDRPDDWKDFINEMDCLNPIKGWFYDNYSKLNKKPFSDKNLQYIDAITNFIFSNDEKYRAVALTSLMLGLKSCDNTLGHFSSYLKNPSERSYNKLWCPYPMEIPHNSNCKVTNTDALDIVSSNYYDLVYLDPPYGSANEKIPSSRVRYESYYHFYKTICLNDKPELFGKVGRRKDSKDNDNRFESYKKNENGNFICLDSIREIINKANTKYVVLSYSNGGRANLEDLIKGYETKIVEIPYQRNVQSSMKTTNEYSREENTKEYLILIDKR